VIVFPPYAELVTRLRTRLGQPLPGLDAQLSLAPQVKANLRKIRDRPDDCRRAAVLILLFPDEEGTTRFVLTLRQKALPAHSGQVCLPGGSMEDGETPRETALREAYEEIGVPVELPDVLGQLTELYIPPSNFCVTPIVAHVDARLHLEKSSDEVAVIIESPLTVLFDAERRKFAIWHLQGQDVRVPYFLIEGHEVWGATAMMLAELAQVVSELVLPPA
jgi:8-oxo-dGTP pyrophosphatase MutT (NUDIX family)